MRNNPHRSPMEAIRTPSDEIWPPGPTRPAPPSAALGSSLRNRALSAHATPLTPIRVERRSRGVTLRHPACAHLGASSTLPRATLPPPAAPLGPCLVSLGSCAAD